MNKRGGEQRGFVNIFVITGYVLLFIVTLLNLYGLKVVPLIEMVIVNPLIYILVVFFSVIFFKEKVNQKQRIGLALIVLGIIIFNIK